MPAKKRSSYGKNDKLDLERERARVELRSNGGKVSVAAKAIGRPRSTVSRWISEGLFEPDEWEHIREEHARSIVELAYEGVNATMEALRKPLHKKALTKDGDVVDLGPDGAWLAQAGRVQLEAIKAFGGKALDVQSEAPLEIVVRAYDPKTDAARVGAPANAPPVRPN